MRIFMMTGFGLMLAASLGACTAMNQVAFESRPSAAVTTSTGQSCPQTPCVIEIPRKESFVATFTKPGYRDAQVTVAAEMSNRGSAMTVASFALGGVAGGIGYAMSGHGHDHTPNPVVADLEPVRSAAPQAGPRKARKKAVPSS